MFEEQFSSNEDIVLPPVRPSEPPVAHVDVDDIDVIFFFFNKIQLYLQRWNGTVKLGKITLIYVILLLT